MSKQGRYATSGLIEDQYMPGSDGTVLRNLQGITSKKDLERIETERLFDITGLLLDEFDQNHCFIANDIQIMHQRWLGTLYEWAGQYRQVMMSKGDFMFAAPAHIPALMLDFEKNVLARATPCVFTNRDDIISALALVHTELILIHPFREGNGRISRLLAVLMALQAGLPLLNFSSFERERQQEYFAAVQHGMDRNYQPMEEIFSSVIDRSLRDVAG